MPKNSPRRRQGRSLQNYLGMDTSTVCVVHAHEHTRIAVLSAFAKLHMGNMGRRVSSTIKDQACSGE